MVELALQEKAAEEATTIYSNKFIEDDSPSSFLNTSTWDLPSRVLPVTELEVWITPALDPEERKTSVINWPMNESPFTQSDLIDIVDKQVQQLIFRIRISISIPNNERIANRLNSLFNAAKEEDPDSPGISSDSIRSFYHFFKKYTNLKYPIITLTPDNDIYASWKGGQNQVFSVHFVSEEDTRFVIFRPNKNHPERKIISYGTDTVDTLLATVTFSGIWDWISDER